MKKILAVIITALTVALTTALSGCSAALSEEEYFDKLMENYSAYGSNIVLISTGFGELTNDPSADTDWSEFETAIAEAKSSLEKIEKLSPPPIYSAQHRDICEKMQAEKDWCDAAEQIINDRGFTDDSENSLVAAGNESKFHTTILNLVIQMRKDGVGDSTISKYNQ